MPQAKSCGPKTKLIGAITQPEGVAADLVEDGETSWTKPTPNGPLRLRIEKTGSHGKARLSNKEKKVTNM